MYTKKIFIMAAGIASLFMVSQTSAALQSTENSEPVSQDTQTTELTPEEQAELDAKRAEMEAAFNSAQEQTDTREVAEQEMQRTINEHKQKIAREKHNKGQQVSEQELKQTEREALGSDYE